MENVPDCANQNYWLSVIFLNNNDGKFLERSSCFSNVVTLDKIVRLRVFDQTLTTQSSPTSSIASD